MDGDIMAGDDLYVDPPYEAPEVEEVIPPTMETRPVLNSDGIEIGEISLPEGTDESIWTNLLALYATSEAPLTEAEIIKNKFLSNMKFGSDLVADFLTRNTLVGLSDEELLAISENALLRQIQLLLLSGDLRLVLLLIPQLQPSDILPQEIIDEFSAKIQKRMESLP